MWSGVRVLALASAAFLPMMPVGATDTLEPGLWSIVTRIGYGRRDVAIRKIARCITADEAKAFPGATSIEWAGKDAVCRSTDYLKAQDGGTWQVRCAGKVKIDATVTSTLKSPQHYTIVFAATARSAGQTMISTRTFEGRRLGDCPP
jgi:hypothetical protein